ncbi:hypothetical protein ACFSOZ_07200 [Mesorhizobium newzealandense]|uniref:Uncharacterized protein n=1 Tax=Mesorhizobium newzealandense TaxID=1300302 RepID=A0ABW4U7Y2_9HYPH
MKLEPDSAPELDAMARAGLTAKQLTDLEALPVRLPLLSLDDIIEEGARIRGAHDDIIGVINAEIDEGDDAVPVVMRRAIAAEYFLRRTCHSIADELQRRRTGVSPRARKMN